MAPKKPEIPPKKPELPLVAYRCNNNYHSSYNTNLYFSDDAGVICPGCNYSMNTKMTYLNSGKNKPQTAVKEDAAELGAGFVKGDLVTYMIMDDLVVKPMSTISSIALLNKLNVKDIGDLEEKEVELGINEGLKLLKASISSKAVS